MKTEKFRFWCQKVLPLVYDDSLSYYELLCKVVDYINNLLEQVEENTEDIEKLKRDFLALKKWCEDYFKNLDIQEEVNKKIDELIEDGTLEEILERLLADVYEKLKDINSYISQEGAWRVFDIKNKIILSKVKGETFTGEEFPEGLLRAWTHESPEMLLPMPMGEAASIASCDNYYGFVSNIFTSKNGTTLKKKSVFFDSGISTEHKVYFSHHIIGDRKTPPEDPQYGKKSKRSQAVAIAKSYYDARVNGRAFAYGDNFVTYAASHAVNNPAGAALMECDTLVAMTMLGVPYEDSPFLNTTPSYTYNFEDMETNPHDYTWCLPWEYNEIAGRKITYTGLENWYFWANKLVYKNPDNIAEGDILVVTKKTSRYFDHVYHVGIMDLKNVNGVMKPYVYHVTSLGRLPSPINYEPLETVVAREGADMEKDVYFARPDYA